GRAVSGGLGVLERDVHGDGLITALEQVPGDLQGGGEDHGHGHGLAQRAPQAEHGSTDHTGLAEGQDRQPDHLPTGRAHGQGGLLVALGHLVEDVAGDRGDDGQDHDRQDDTGGQDGPAGGGGWSGEERD